MYAKPSASRSIWWSSQVLNSSQVCLVRVSPAFVTRSRHAIAKELARWLRLRPWLRHEHAAHIPCKIRVLTLRLTSLASPRISAPRQVPHSDQPIRLPSTLRRPAAMPPPPVVRFSHVASSGRARRETALTRHRTVEIDTIGSASITAAANELTGDETNAHNAKIPVFRAFFGTARQFTSGFEHTFAEHHFERFLDIWRQRQTPPPPTRIFPDVQHRRHRTYRQSAPAAGHGATVEAAPH